ASRTKSNPVKSRIIQCPAGFFRTSRESIHSSSYPHQFSSRHISDEMSVKIVLSINLSPVAAVVDLLAITALSGCIASHLGHFPAKLYPYEKYSIVNHFQYHLLN